MAATTLTSPFSRGATELSPTSTSTITTTNAAAASHPAPRHPAPHQTTQTTARTPSRDQDITDKYSIRNVLLTFYNQTEEDAFLTYYASTMYARRWIFILLILWGFFILLISVDMYRLIYDIDTTEHWVASGACVLVYATSRICMGVLTCTVPKTNRERYNRLRLTAGICVVLIHSWEVIFINPISYDTQGIKLPVVQAFASLGELIFLGFHFTWLIPCLCVLSFNLLVWEFRCATPAFGIMMVFVFLLIGFILWDRERIIREAWAAHERRGVAILESQRNAAHDIKNDLQEVVGLVSTLGNYDESDSDGGGGGANGQLVVQYTEEKESDSGPRRNYSSDSTSSKEALHSLTQEQLRHFAIKKFAYQESPVTKASAANTTKFAYQESPGERGGRTGKNTETNPSAANTTTPTTTPDDTTAAATAATATTVNDTTTATNNTTTANGTTPPNTTTDRSSSTSSTASLARSISSTSSTSSASARKSTNLTSNKESLLDYDVKSRVTRAAGRITTRLETGLRDTASAIERKLLLPTIEPCDLASIVYRDVAYDPLIAFEKDEDFPSIIETDAAWMRNCVANLVGNAKKHGPKESKIVVRLLWFAKLSELKIEIEDEGSGVSDDQAISIFLDRGSAVGENGIGLQAVHTYITGLGGSVGAKGSVFWLKLPVREKPVVMDTITLSFSGNAEEGFRESYNKLSIPIMLLCFLLYSTMTFLNTSMAAQDSTHHWYCEYTSNATNHSRHDHTTPFRVYRQLLTLKLVYTLVPIFTVGIVFLLRGSYTKSRTVYWFTICLAHALLILCEVINVVSFCGCFCFF